jgi:hypothetical protein
MRIEMSRTTLWGVGASRRYEGPGARQRFEGFEAIGGTKDGEVVLTSSSKGETPFAITVTVPGVTVHMLSNGSPVHGGDENETVPAKPFMDTTCNWYLAVPPAFTVADIAPPFAAVIEKSTAVPPTKID